LIPSSFSFFLSSFLVAETAADQAAVFAYLQRQEMCSFSLQYLTLDAKIKEKFSEREVNP